MAEQARERYNDNPTAEKFRVWRDASEIAIKWNRAVRSEGRDDDDAFDRLLSTK
jgi:hypothetical protein